MLTKLDAVNQCLDGIGEDPVATLADAEGIEDVKGAVRVLDRVTKEVLTKGWHRNITKNLTLQRNPDKRILLPENVLRIDGAGNDKYLDITQARLDGVRHLYNAETQSFEFDHDVTVEVVWLLDFELLTPDLQMYIAAKASKEYQQVIHKSEVADAYLKQKEAETWVSLLDAEAELEDANALRDNDHCRYIAGRNHPMNGR